MLILRRLILVVSLSFATIAVDLTTGQWTEPVQGQDIVSSQTLKVGVVGNPPFVVYGENDIDATGISLDVWQAIAQSQQWDSQYLRQKSISEGIKAVAEGELDILIGPISITPERAAIKGIIFSQPYFSSGIGLLIPGKPASLWERLAPFFGLAALSSAGILILLLFLVGNLIWLAEHRANPEQFPPHYPDGLHNGMWFALVTLTTVGYGDQSPKTKLGQLVAGVWMVVALLSFSSITAGLASAFTTALSEANATPAFRSVGDLKNKDVAVVQDTTAVDWAKFYRAEITEVSSLKGAVTLLERKQVDAVMFDRPALIYYTRRNPHINLEVTEIRVSLEPYGFVLRENSPMQRVINVQILDLLYGRVITRFTERWLGAEVEENQDLVQ
ncbi:MULTISPECIES: transporter substrate-binding domain-containing protein [unclassified Synechocystis]|uniref:transporter substrate-binding domain-containing protein n=1 Tax=unclassified Synechocystis TaxID=2640012 RepID=UPI000408B4FF|nr:MULTISPECIES: transporter substrate-binding domain-containing protein [unclassified Synechocystis]AIE74791.1 putative ligand gated channel (GIC family) [Synechocystis sp. PCC 6714]MCT0253476.1 transporter substrate-binding domain-containing protein [Synechocystis sp. CS-94]